MQFPARPNGQTTQGQRLTQPRYTDNAVVESFFSSLKRELMGENIFETREVARQAVFEFIEVFYNRQRRHSTLGYLTPHEFERQATAA